MAEAIINHTQVHLVMEEISKSMMAIERASYMLQAQCLEDPRDMDAMHFAIQCMAQRAGLLSELVSSHCGHPSAPDGLVNQACAWQWFLPPAFFEPNALQSPPLE